MVRVRVRDRDRVRVRGAPAWKMSRLSPRQAADLQRHLPAPARTSQLTLSGGRFLATSGARPRPRLPPRASASLRQSARPCFPLGPRSPSSQAVLPTQGSAAAHGSTWLGLGLGWGWGWVWVWGWVWGWGWGWGWGWSWGWGWGWGTRQHLLPELVDDSSGRAEL